MSKNSYNFKVVLLGEGCVGKTSCVVRYVEDTFSDRHVTTLQVRLIDLSRENTLDHALMSRFILGFFLDEEVEPAREASLALHLGHGGPGEVPRTRANILQVRGSLCFLTERLVTSLSYVWFIINLML